MCLFIGEPLIPQCSLPGCSVPRHFDRVNGVMYECCSRDHGKQYILQFHQPSPDSKGSVWFLRLILWCNRFPAVPQNLKCKNPKCYRKKYPVGDGTFYDYCGKTCRDFVSKAAPGPGTWTTWSVLWVSFEICCYRFRSSVCSSWLLSCCSDRAFILWKVSCTKSISKW